jgi:activator of HSP90 ATPase
MSERRNPSAIAKLATRRQMIAGVGIAIGGLAAGSRVFGQAQQKMTETQSTGLAGLLTYLHQEIPINAKPERIYGILLDSKQFAAFTGMAAEIDPKAGGAFSMFGGLIVGRNVELLPEQRIVQAWRPASWDPGVYSIVKFGLKAHGSGAVVVLDHTGFPEGDFSHLDPGWYERYWEPLKRYLS